MLAPGSARAQSAPASSFTAVAPDKFSKLDQEPRLTHQVGDDRLLRYLIKNPPPVGQKMLLQRPYLERVVALSTKNGSALQLIGASLHSGDELLRRAITTMMQEYNFSQRQIDSAISAWAANTPTDSIRAILETLPQRPAALAPLVQYLLDTSLDWPGVCSRTRSVLARREYLTPEMLQAALIGNELITPSRAQEVLTAAGQDDVAARFRLMTAILNLLPSRGTVARFLQQPVATPNAWLTYIWDNAAAGVAANPVHLSEYVRRLGSLRPLYDQWRTVLIEALTEEDKEFFPGYYQAAIIEKSRFAWTVDNLLNAELDPQLAEAGTRKLQTVLREKMLLQLKVNEAFSDWVLWQLTRPAEAFCLTVRAGLPTVLKDSVEINRRITASLDQLSKGLQAKLEELGVFNFYGDPSVFRQRAARGNLDEDALQRFGESFGQILRYDDTAWSGFLFNAEQRQALEPRNDIRQQVISEILVRDVGSLAALVQTIQANDALLKRLFGDWLVRQKEIASIEMYEDWLTQVNAEVAKRQITGSPQVAQFKSRLLEFLQTRDGWRAMEIRLLAESTLVNFRLRDSLIAYLKTHPDSLWKTLGITTSTQGQLNASLGPRLQHFIQYSQIHADLLRAVSEQNQTATDVLFPVWDKLLADRAPVLESIINTILEGNVLGDLYFVFLNAFLETMQTPQNAKLLEPAMRSIPELANIPDATILQQQARTMLRNQALRAMPILISGMRDDTFREDWRRAFITQVRIFGKSYVVADHIQRKTQLQDVWQAQVSQALFDDPSLLEQVLRALVVRKRSDTEWVNAVQVRREQVAQVILQDRIMFEQLLAHKQDLFASVLREEAVKIFGQNIAEGWLGRRVEP